MLDMNQEDSGLNLFKTGYSGIIMTSIGHKHLIVHFDCKNKTKRKSYRKPISLING